MTPISVTGLMSYSAALMAARIMGSVAGLGAQFILAWSMSANDLGLFYVVTSMVLLLGTIAALGYPAIANQLLVRYTVRGNKPAAKAFIETARRDALTASFLLAGGATLVAAIVAARRPEVLVPAVVGALAVPAFAMLRVNGGVANAFQRFSLAFLPDNFIRPVLLILGLATIFLFNGSLSLLQAISVFAILAITISAAQTAAIGWSGRIAGPPARTRPGRTKCWRRSGAQLVAPLLISALFADIAIVIAGLILPAAQIAVFGLCVKIAFLFGFIIQLVHQLVLPQLALSLTGRDRAEVVNTIGRTNAVAIFSTLAAFFSVAVAGEYVLGLFGAGFRVGEAALLVLIFTQFVRALGGPALSVLIASGRHASAAGVMVASLLIFTVSCLLLAPPYGIVGAALAVFLATTASCAGLAIVVRRELGYRCDALSACG